jgi:hypothetical protein
VAVQGFKTVKVFKAPLVIIMGRTIVTPHTISVIEVTFSGVVIPDTKVIHVDEGGIFVPVLKELIGFHGSKGYTMISFINNTRVSNMTLWVHPLAIYLIIITPYTPAPIDVLVMNKGVSFDVIVG